MSLKKDKTGAEQRALVYGRERDAARAAEGVKTKQVEGLTADLAVERSRQGATAGEQRELTLRRKKGVIEGTFAAGVQGLQTKRAKDIAGLREEDSEGTKPAVSTGVGTATREGGEDEPLAKRVRFSVPPPEPSNLQGKFGKPGLKRAPRKV